MHKATVVAAVVLALAVGVIIGVLIPRQPPLSSQPLTPVPVVAPSVPAPEVQVLPEPEPTAPARIETVEPQPSLEDGPNVNLRPLTMTVRGKDDPQAIPYGTAGFAAFDKYLSQIERDTSRGVQTIQGELEIDPETAERFIAYMREARDQESVRQQQAVEEICGRRDSIITLSDVAKALDKLDDAVHAARVDIVKNAGSVLGTTGMDRLETQIAVRRKSITRTTIDKEKALIATGRTRDDVVRQMCDARNASQGMQ